MIFYRSKKKDLLIEKLEKNQAYSYFIGGNTMELKNGLILNIEKAKREDAAKIIEYLNQVGGESDNLLFGLNEFHVSVSDEENFIDKLAASTTSALLIGKTNDEVVSVATIMSPHRPRIAHQADISISVKKKYWNMGIATHMISELISFAKQNQITKILHLGVKAENTNAICLYEKMGFEKIGEYKNFFKIGDLYYNEILMNLYL